MRTIPATLLKAVPPLKTSSLGSGGCAALLPFEPGTGNFTKIVQRVPVRIRLAAGAPANLRPGLSATVRVRVGD